MKHLCWCCGIAVLMGPVLAAGLMYVALMYAPDLPEGIF